MSETVIWVHMDALTREHPVFGAAGDDARAVYVWDAEDVARRGWSLKRCVFVLECLDMMDVEIVEGRYADVLAGLSVFAAKTPDPVLLDVLNELDATVIDERPFATLSETADMGRFFRYWNKAKSTAMRPSLIGSAS